MAVAAASRNGNEAAETNERTIELPRIELREAEIVVSGISPLIMHRWSDEALKKLEDSQTGRAKQQKTARDPEQEWLSSCYVVPGREDWDDWKPGKYFFPAAAFKHAFLYGVSQIDDKKSMPKTKATGWLFLNDDPILDFESVSLRTDIGRNPTRPVYRPQFNGWSAELQIGYNARALTIEQVIALFDLGGFAGGVGDWRPTSPKNKSGSFGRFRVTRVVEK